MEQQRLERERLEAVLGADTFFFLGSTKTDFADLFQNCDVQEQRIRQQLVQAHQQAQQAAQQAAPLEPPHPMVPPVPAPTMSPMEATWWFYRPGLKLLFLQIQFTLKLWRIKNDKELNMESCWKSLSIGFHAVPSMPGCSCEASASHGATCACPNHVTHGGSPIRQGNCWKLGGNCIWVFPKNGGTPKTPQSDHF